MTGFSADWLSLREAADAAARDRAGLTDDVLPAIDAVRPGAARPEAAGGPLRILDLAAGAGNNRRYLSPRLAREQRWTLVDSDAELLARAGAVETVVLDLVSAAWLARLADAMAAARVPAALFALTLDARHDWQPREAEDEEIARLLHHHMAGDKGFGPALGPDAPASIAAIFARAGYRVTEADSAWDLGGTDAALQTALIDGYAAAAEELAPARVAEIADWADRRRAHAAAGRGRHRVGHRDHLLRLEG